MAAHESEPSTMSESEMNLFNRTGVMINPEMSAEMIQAAKNMKPASGDISELAAERLDYISEAIPIGSYPAPVDGHDAAEAEKRAVLFDKLGERLAFERQGTRLYQTFIQKLEAMPAEEENGPTSDELRHICDEELEHFRLLQRAITDLGGDAPARTDPDHPFIQLVAKTAEEVYEMPQKLIPMSGGSGPNHPFVHVLGLPVATGGLGYPDTKAHAPNENIRIDLYLKHARHMARLIDEFSK